jgi:hypothetical protein
MDLEEMLKSAMEASVWEPSGTAEEMVAKLDSAIEISTGNCPFKVGDYVTPIKNGNEKGRGKPFRVIEVKDNFEIACEPQRGEPLTMYNMVVAVMLTNGSPDYYRSNAALYEPFDPEKVVA